MLPMQDIIEVMTISGGWYSFPHPLESIIYVACCMGIEREITGLCLRVLVFCPYS